MKMRLKMKMTEDGANGNNGNGGKNKGRGWLPLFAEDHKSNPFEHRSSLGVSVRSGSTSGTYEMFIMLSRNEFLRGTFKPMQGFFDAQTPRKTLKSLFSKTIDAGGNLIKRK
jgi:hypothetical protein